MSINKKAYNRAIIILSIVCAVLSASIGWLLFGPGRANAELAQQGEDLGGELDTFAGSLTDSTQEYGELAERGRELDAGYTELGSQVSGFGDRTGSMARGLVNVGDKIQSIGDGLQSDIDGLRSLSDELGSYLAEIEQSE